MLREKVDKIGKIDPDIYVEIFCPTKYRGYSIRGQMREIALPIYDGFETKDISELFFYRFVIMGLINKQYMKNFHVPYSIFPFGKIVGRDKREYKKLLRENLRKYAENESPDSKEQRKLHRDKLRYYESIPSLTIKRTDCDDILNTEYVNQSIAEEKEIILLDLEMWYHNWTSVRNGAMLTIPLENIYLFLLDLFETKVKYRKGKLIDWFTGDLLKILSEEFHYRISSKKEIISILRLISKTINKPYMSEEDSSRNKYKQDLNDLMAKINYIRFPGLQHKTIEKRQKIDNDPVRRFCFRFFDDFIDSLVQRANMKLCKNCGNFIIDKRKWKFCSDDCRIKYYTRYDQVAHRKERRRAKREYMRKKRAEERSPKKI